MRHGWVYMYESPPASVRLEELITILQKEGISLERPRTGEVARLSSEGERIVCPREELFAELEASGVVNVQFYLDENTGLFASVRKNTKAVIEESFGLDGQTEEESMHVIRSLAKLFAQRAEHGTAFAFVADSHADLQPDFHWDDFVLGERTAPPEWPIFLGFRNDFEKKRFIPQGLYNHEVRPGYTLFWRADFEPSKR